MTKTNEISNRELGRLLREYKEAHWKTVIKALPDLSIFSSLEELFGSIRHHHILINGNSTETTGSNQSQKLDMYILPQFQPLRKALVSQPEIDKVDELDIYIDTVADQIEAMGWELSDAIDLGPYGLFDIYDELEYGDF